MSIRPPACTRHSASDLFRSVPDLVRSRARLINSDGNRYADILTFDSLYAQASLINEVLEQNKIAVIRVKQEHYHIIRDAAGLFTDQAPDLEATLSLKSSWYAADQAGEKYRYRVKIWDAEGFDSWAGVKVPVWKTLFGSRDNLDNCFSVIKPQPPGNSILKQPQETWGRPYCL